MIDLQLPASPEAIRALHAGDEVSIGGRIVTARDMAHKYMVEHKPAFLGDLLSRSIIYHCGPIMKRTPDGWEVIAAGPTTSMREEPYEADVIATYGPAGIMGKGGMGAATIAACRAHGAAYFHAIGGLAAALARCVRRVEEVYLLEEFGIPEALWVLDVEHFPAIVTIDAGGQDLHREIRRAAEERAAAIVRGEDRNKDDA